MDDILLGETPLPPRVHEALLEAARQAAKTVAGAAAAGSPGS